MNVHCCACGEPWEIDYLLQEAILETDLYESEAESWRRLPPAEKLSRHYREEFRASGWEFGRTVVNVIHCPMCPPTACADPVRLQAKAVLEERLGDNELGLAACFANYHL